MSIIVPLHKWRSADPAILIGRRCIAQIGSLPADPTNEPTKENKQ